MFGIFKDRKLNAFKRSMSARIAERGTNVQRLIENQIMLAVEHIHCSRQDAWQDPYTPFYVFGACDAVTCEFPVEVRQKVAPGIIELSFLMVAQSVFNVSDLDAKLALMEVFGSQRMNPTNPAIIDGGVDGYEMMQGKPATRLLEHLYDKFAG